MSLPRIVKPELLDSLPEGHPDALHNRRDLRIFNALQGNYRWLARSLRRRLQPGDRVLELGSGMGDLGLHLLRKGLLRGVTWDAVDLWSRPASWPAEWSWHQTDLLSFSRYRDYDLIVGNLIVHQFDDEELASLGERLGADGTRTRHLLFCETLRHRLPLMLLPLTRLLGTGHVSNHDAAVSVEGGFRDDELPRLLKLPADRWTWTCGETALLGQYRFSAKRNAAATSGLSSPETTK